MLNVFLGCAYIVLNLYQFYLLPILLLGRGGNWGWSLAPLVLLTNPFWSLIHEAIHDLFHPSRTINGFFGRLLAILFGSPFRIIRIKHLLHHKLNRLPIEGTEYYDQDKASRSGAAPAYYFQICWALSGRDLKRPLRFLAAAIFTVDKKPLHSGEYRQHASDGELAPAGGAARNPFRWFFDAAGSRAGVFLLRQNVVGTCPGALLGRGFLISFLDNVYHYETPVSDVFFAKNLRLPAPFTSLLLNFNLHGIHHVNPAIPWIHLPRAFSIQAGQFQGGYFIAALRQLHGPIAIQDLPREPQRLVPR